MADTEPCPRWYWEEDDKTWHAYNPGDSDILETIARTGGTEVELDGKYKVNIVARTQIRTDISGGNHRRVIRATWFWQDSKQHWNPYPEEAAEKLEAAFYGQMFGQKIGDLGLGSFHVILDGTSGTGKQFAGEVSSMSQNVRRGYEGRSIPRVNVDSRERAIAAAEHQQKSGGNNFIDFGFDQAPVDPDTLRSDSPGPTRLSATPKVRRKPVHGIWKEGFVGKKSGGWKEKKNIWKNRYLIITTDSIGIYEDRTKEKEKIALGKIARCETFQDARCEAGFHYWTIKTFSSHEFHFRCSTLAETNEWIDIVNEACHPTKDDPPQQSILSANATTTTTTTGPQGGQSGGPQGGQQGGPGQLHPSNSNPQLNQPNNPQYNPNQYPPSPQPQYTGGGGGYPPGQSPSGSPGTGSNPQQGWPGQGGSQGGSPYPPNNPGTTPPGYPPGWNGPQGGNMGGPGPQGGNYGGPGPQGGNFGGPGPQGGNFGGPGPQGGNYGGPGPQGGNFGGPGPQGGNFGGPQGGNYGGPGPQGGNFGGPGPQGGNFGGPQGGNYGGPQGGNFGGPGPQGGNFGGPQGGNFGGPGPQGGNFGGPGPQGGNFGGPGPQGGNFGGPGPQGGYGGGYPPQGGYSPQTTNVPQGYAPPGYPPQGGYSPMY